MCGICGQALNGGEVNEQVIRKMNQTLRHRGPDGAGIRIMGRVGFGHRRLSIIDLAGGAQPMGNEDGTVWISYNGEIYNHEEIRGRLVRAGHVYRTHSDTETVIHLYEEKGEKCVEDLRGMFAFSLWDARKKKLILARDRLGIKPLYYARRRGDLIWGSEIKAVLASGRIQPRLRIESLPEYLANGYVTGEYTLFQDILRLPPGHLLTWHDGRTAIESYWDIPEPDGTEISEQEAVEEFLRLFEESVRLRLMSDVPLGMFLSGGIDSSAISAVMSRMVSRPIKTFSVAFQERDANEFAYARMVARKFGTDHHEVTVTPAAFFRKLPDLIWHEDEPIAFPSSIPLYFVSELAAGQVKVVLTGEGSDELLAGYGRYGKTILNLRLGGIYSRLFPGIVRRPVSAAIERMGGGSDWNRKLSRSFLCIEPEIVRMYYDNFSVFNRRSIGDLLQPAWRSIPEFHDPYGVHLAWFDSRKGPLLDRILYADMKTYLHELLMKQDQMSMAASIESRVPFLDHKLVEFASGLPTRLKLRGLTTKYILKKSMKGILPEEILGRRKMGFPVPLKAWFRQGPGEELTECLTGSRAASRGLFDVERIEVMLRQHREGAFNHSERLWSLLNFELWNRIYIDGEDVRQIASLP